MGRGRVELKRIENKFNRQVTFSKRRAGLIKKAQEISVLCEADVAVIVVSSKGRLFEYSSDQRMEGILQRYERYSNAKKQVQVSASEEHLTLEYAKLKARLEVLQRNKRQLMGEDLDTASLRELQHLEQQLDSALKHIRKKKNRQMNESLSKLQKKEKALQELRDLLDKKVNEEKAMMAQKLPQQVCSGSNNYPSSSSIQPRTIPSSHLRSSSNGSESGEILPAEESQPIGPVLPPWMLRALN